jgi:hypothetical protein
MRDRHASCDRLSASERHQWFTQPIMPYSGTHMHFRRRHLVASLRLYGSRDCVFGLSPNE